MRRLWKVIKREMGNARLNAKQMARKLRIDPAHLSRLHNGQLRDLSPEVLGRLINGLGTTDELRSELLVAYLHDKLKGNRSIAWRPTAENLRELAVHEDALVYEKDLLPTVSDACLRAGLNLRVAGAIEFLVTEARGNRRLQTLLISLAEFAGKEEPSEEIGSQSELDEEIDLQPEVSDEENALQPEVSDGENAFQSEAVNEEIPPQPEPSNQPEILNQEIALQPEIDRS